MTDLPKRMREYEVTLTVKVELEPGEDDTDVIADLEKDIPFMVGFEASNCVVKPKLPLKES